ncbi:hypothetical protein [Pseudomonas sp. H1h]|uniref:hypothetical protein n=1 Tax=Pseudomonas sp. H1h TaxID=1397280 RepID=UPI0012FEFB64|nr:hypothetical protein [Pseudomonas sp. H1h]
MLREAGNVLTDSDPDRQTRQWHHGQLTAPDEIPYKKGPEGPFLLRDKYCKNKNADHH